MTSITSETCRGKASWKLRGAGYKMAHTNGEAKAAAVEGPQPSGSGFPRQAGKDGGVL